MRVMLLVLLFSSLGFAQEKSTVRVGTSTGMGTGTVVAKEGDSVYILTCKHVVSKDRKIFVVHDKKIYTGTLHALGATDDLALVKVPLKGIEAVSVASDDVQKDDKVTHYGTATGPMSGKVTGHTNFVGPEGKVINTDAFCVAGDSGGGFYNKDGKLVGVLCGRIGKTITEDPESGETYFCSGSRVRAFLKENLPKEK